MKGSRKTNVLGVGRARMRMTIGALVVLLAPASFAAAGGVKLKLEASSRNLYAPARVVIKATMSGGADTDPELRCLTEEWSYQQVFETTTNREVNKSIRSSPCASETQPVAIQRNFSNQFVFSQWGRYFIRLILRNPKGKAVASASLSVQVLQPANPYYQ